MKKILLIHNIITPTRTLLFNKLYEHFFDLWYELKIIFTSESESNRKRSTNEEIKKFKFPYIILKSNQLKVWKKDKFYYHFNWNLSSILNKEKPNIIIHDWWSWFSVFQSLYRCKKNKKKFYLWSWSTKYEKSRRRTLTKPIVKFIVKHCDWYRSYWTRASEYLVSLWAKKEKIYPLYNTVDIDYFKEEAEKLKPHKEELKKKYWIKTNNVLLFVWQLIERKWIYEVLEWFKNFQKDNKDWSLIFVWWWQENEKMKQIIKEQNIKNVFFPWFFQKDKISELYTIADIFTLPSREEVRWLVINEAMCFWLPIITAYQVWASVDLVKDWENGYIMKENTWEEIKRCLNKILENKLIKKNSSFEKIKKFNVRNIINLIKF